MFIERMHETHYKSVTPKIIKLESQEYSFFFFFLVVTVNLFLSMRTLYLFNLHMHCSISLVTDTFHRSCMSCHQARLNKTFNQAWKKTNVST